MFFKKKKEIKIIPTIFFTYYKLFIFINYDNRTSDNIEMNFSTEELANQKSMKILNDLEDLSSVFLSIDHKDDFMNTNYTLYKKISKHKIVALTTTVIQMLGEKEKPCQ